MRLCCLVVALALLAAFASDSWGQLQQPSQSAGKVVTEPQAQSGKNSDNAKADERGTEHFPIVVKVLPTPNTQEQATAEAKHEDEKAANDRRVATFTELLFYATVALAVIAALQLFVFGWQGFQLRNTVKETREATRAAQAESIATHRPRLRVRNVVVERPANLHTQRFSIFHPGYRVKGQFFVANTGGGAATIQGGHCKVFWTNRSLPMKRPYEGDDDNLSLVSQVLAPGESTPVIFASDELVPDTVKNVGIGAIGGSEIYVMGWIAYLDANGVSRRTAFCRKYIAPEGGDGWFVKVENPDYEHEE
jgi:hypothetical protein